MSYNPARRLKRRTSRKKPHASPPRGERTALVVLVPRPAKETKLGGGVYHREERDPLLWRVTNVPPLRRLERRRRRNKLARASRKAGRR